jgi:hypothetical protein
VRNFGFSTVPQLQVRRLDGHRVRVVHDLDYLLDDRLRFDRLVHVEIAAVAVRAERMAKDAQAGVRTPDVEATREAASVYLEPSQAFEINATWALGDRNAP